jgi:hypothetical protein
MNRVKEILNIPYVKLTKPISQLRVRQRKAVIVPLGAGKGVIETGSILMMNLLPKKALHGNSKRW